VSVATGHRAEGTPRGRSSAWVGTPNEEALPELRTGIPVEDFGGKIGEGDTVTVDAVDGALVLR
jgi:hypothetical protein